MERKRKVKRKAVISIALGMVIIFTMAACKAGEETEKDTGTGMSAETKNENSLLAETGIPSFELSSLNLKDGVWDSVITNTDHGKNVSPQLSWDPVEGAGTYVIYMIDSSADNWVHWISSDVTEPNLSEGWATESEYIGPYPPDRTHTYEIYVIALKEPATEVKGTLNAADSRFKEKLLALDEVADGSTGNMLAYGHLSGTYTAGD